jgi:ribosomal protein L11 methylase PrmA
LAKGDLLRFGSLKVVLDVGCGTGVFSMFAAKEEASRESSGIIEQAKIIVKDNGNDDRITHI